MSGLHRNRQRPASGPPVNPYDKRNSDAESVYNADLVPPATSYATVRSGLSVQGFAPPTLRPKTRAAYVNRIERRDGIRNMWSWGAVNMFPFTASLPKKASGGMSPGVNSTEFQPNLVQLHDWSQNDQWYICWNGTGSGLFQGSQEIRYDYPSFRVEQVETRTSGGPGPVGTSMQPRNRYTAVQKIRKYTATPRYYNTTSGWGGYSGHKGSSNVNGTGSG